MALRAVKPEKLEKRLKLFVFGPPGVGKTSAMIRFPNAYIFDCEKGTENYANTISKAGSVVMRTNNPDEIQQELRALLTEKHPYKSVVIDPVTQVYHSVQEKWTRIFERHSKNEKEAELLDFGMRFWGKVKADYKVILRLLMALDMNVLVSSHMKDIYGPNMQKIGVGADSMRGDDYIFDLVFQLKNVGGKRMAETLKERAEIGHNKFPPEFEWSYENFLKYFGKDVIEREAVPVAMATPEQVAEITRLLEVVKINDEDVTKLFTKHDVDSWGELTAEAIQKYIDTLKKKIAPMSAEKAAANV